MSRKNSILILIAMIAAMLVNLNSVKAANTQVQNVFIADFSNSQFVGALVHPDGDSVKAIKFNATQGETFEDFFPSNAATITATVDMESTTMTAYSSEYGKMIELSFEYYTDDHHSVGYCEQSKYNSGLTFCQLDGDHIQARGFITNGIAIKLRGADAFSISRGLGYLVQNGNLISYAIENKEEQKVYTIYMATIAR
jgi:hypothetical protein